MHGTSSGLRSGEESVVAVEKTSFVNGSSLTQSTIHHSPGEPCSEHIENGELEAWGVQDQIEQSFAVAPINPVLSEPANFGDEIEVGQYTPPQQRAEFNDFFDTFPPLLAQAFNDYFVEGLTKDD